MQKIAPELLLSTNLNYSKYGFELVAERDKIIIYEAHPRNKLLRLQVLGDTHTLVIVTKRGEIPVFNRYEITSQYFLDLLIMNGRAGVLFS